MKAGELSVAVVVLNWNGRHHLADYLPSVLEHSGGARVIVADNGSHDDSEAVVGALGAEWLALPQNFGFAGGYNRALEQIEADVYVLLNSDVRVTAGWLLAPLRRLREDSGAGAVQPKVLADERPREFEYAGACGGFMDRLGYPYCRGRVFETVERDRGQYDHAVRCDWATGAACFVRAAAWREVGGFDDRFFAHMEEIDLCWRLRRAGYAIWCEPASVVYHLGGGTLAYSSPTKVYLNFRNSLSMLLKNGGGPAATLARLVPRLLLDGVAGLRFLAQGNRSALWAVVRAHGAFYRSAADSWRRRGESRVSPAVAVDGTRPLSIVAEYYLRGRRRFAELPAHGRAVVED